MTKFWAHLHVGTTIEFLGDSWEDGGFSVDEEGNPTTDSLGNTVQGFSADPVDTAADAFEIYEAYTDDHTTDRAEFIAYLADRGFSEAERSAIVAKLSDNMKD